MLRIYLVLKATLRNWILIKKNFGIKNCVEMLIKKNSVKIKLNYWVIENFVLVVTEIHFKD